MDGEVDSRVIQADVLKIASYLRAAKHGIDHPQMFEDVGVHIADDVVPETLHAEVSSSSETIDSRSFVDHLFQLVRELDALAGMEFKDFHPGSLGKVRSPVHEVDQTILTLLYQVLCVRFIFFLILYCERGS